MFQNVLCFFVEKQYIMYNTVYQDIIKELQSLKISLMLIKEFFRIVIAIVTADIRSYSYYHTEKAKHEYKAYKMNFNVMTMVHIDKYTHKVSDVFMVASDNEVITLARKLRWLPKRITAPIMLQRNSVFYTTSPRMSRIKAINKYLKYAKAMLEKKYSDKMIAETPINVACA